ncbi:MAG: hypothetical protein ABW046_17605, partial [Actinoplanes sp.]
MSDISPVWGIVGRLPELTEAGRVELAEMVRDGPRRGELISAILFQLDFAARPLRNVGIYLRFLDRLAPTLPECAVWSSQFLRLATSPVPAVVNFAVRALAEFDQAGQQLEPYELVPALVVGAASRHAATAR